MDSIRTQIASMKKVENNLLINRSDKAEQSKTFFFWSLILTTVLSISVIGIAFYQINKSQSKSFQDAKEKEVIAQVTLLVGGDISLETAGRNLLEFLSKHFGVLAGRLFMTDHNSIKPIASYALKNFKQDGITAVDSKNESNLIQTALTHNDVWEITSVPENYWHVSSSLGESIP